MNNNLLKKILILSVLINTALIIYFMSSFLSANYEERISLTQIKDVFVDRKYFGEGLKLKDYSETRFKLTDNGKSIIKNAREFHSITSIIKSVDYDKNLCAGFLYELSGKLWGATSPYNIGMMDPVSKTAADAWQLPYSYEYSGGKIEKDFSKTFSLKENNYWEVINLADLKDFFNIAFFEKSLLGDIGFLYNATTYISELDIYGNYNSHIGKNMGVSDFEYTLKLDQIGNSGVDIIKNIFSCDEGIFEKLKPILANYYITLNGNQIVLVGKDFYYLGEKSILGEKVKFTFMDKIVFRDISIAHFFHGARVDSLYDMTCSGEFSPINILSINPRLIEKY